MNYADFYRRSIEQPQEFWGGEASRIHWETPYTRVLDDSQAPLNRWFVGGRTNLCYNAVDRWAQTQPGQAALVAVSTEVSADGEPVGYIQYWFVGDHQSEAWIASNPWLALVPSDTLGIDMSIGRPEWLGRGVGSQVLRAFADELWAAGHRNLIIDPDPANARAIAAYRKAGFEPVRHLVGKTGDCVILSYGKIGSRTSGTLASGSGPIDGTST